MKSSKQELIINHKAIDLYNIVLNIEEYPNFIPWCNEIKIQEKSKNQILADMVVSYKNFFPQKFTSKVFFNKTNLQIKTRYINGPLNDLNTEWIFFKMNNNKTKVVFKIEFVFQKSMHQKIAEFFFNFIENKMIDSFKKRADDILN